MHRARAGLAFLPIGLTAFAGALMASRLVHRLGIRRQLVIAPLITAAAVYWLSQLSPGSSYFGSLFVPLVLAAGLAACAIICVAVQHHVAPATSPRKCDRGQTSETNDRPLASAFRLGNG